MPAFPRRDNRAGRHGRPIRTGRADKPVIHTPSVALRVAIVGVGAVVLVAMIIFRLWFLQILSAQQYVSEANDNRLRSVTVVAPRGTILDRNGTVIVQNRAGLAIGVRPMDVPAGQFGALVERLAKVLHMKQAKIRSELVDSATASVVREPGEKLAAYRRRVWQGILSGDWQQYELVVIKDDVNRPLFSYVLEHKQAYPGVEVRKSFLRDYPQGTLAAHLLGNLGPITQDELKLPQFRKYGPLDVIGQSGVESTYDRWLRGTDGSVRVEVDANGHPKRVVGGGKLPTPGDNLVLTLDSRVQKAAEAAVRYGINVAHANSAPRADAGAAVVLDANTGAVVAMASYPTFDPSVWVGGISTKHLREVQRPAANNPLMNRADQGQYPTGSTFKAVDAVAALQEGVITAGTIFTCNGSFKPPHTLDASVWHCWNPLGHGAISLVTALAESCDVYFYNVGYDFYVRKGEALEDWAKRLGYGHVTGLDIPGEEPGRVPTPEWKDKTYTKDWDPNWQVDRLWKPGDSINLAIGQGNLLATPLQVAVSYAAIANGGMLVHPYLGDRIVDSQGQVVQRIDHPAPNRLDIAKQTLDTVRQGLREAASSPIGTSSAVFGGYPIAVSGKTGTAQVAGKGDYAWYVSYAPSDAPKYVVVVMIEQGGHGGVAAAPAARMIYNALFHVRAGQAVGPVRSD